MTHDNLSAAKISELVERSVIWHDVTDEANYHIVWDKPKKQGRQGYALILFRDYLGFWNWTIETQNGIEVAHSARPSSRRWSAVRSAKRLSDNISNVYIEDETGTRTEA